MRFDKLSDAQAGALFVLALLLTVPIVLSLLFFVCGVTGRAWHWMLAGF